MKKVMNLVQTRWWWWFIHVSEKKHFAGANTSFFMVKHLCSTLWEVSPNAGQFKRGFCDLMPTKSLSSSDVSTGDFWRLGIFYQFIFLNVFGWSLAQHLSFLFKGFSSKTTRYVRPEKNSIHPDMDRRNEVPCRACLEPNESGLPGVQSSDVQNPDPQKVTSLWGGHVTSNAICICMYIYVKRIWSDLIWYDIWYDMIWYDMIWYDMTYDMTWHMIWYDMTYDMIWYDITYDMTWHMIWYDMTYDMIWYDMIWYDMTYDMTWHMIWYDMTYDMIWYDMIWHDIWYDMTYDMIWHDIWYDMTWHMIWYDMIWHDIWYDMTYDMIWHDIWYDMIWYDMIWYDMIWHMIWYDVDDYAWNLPGWFGGTCHNSPPQTTQHKVESSTHRRTVQWTITL